MTGLAVAVIVLGAAVLVLGIRDWRREVERRSSFDEHCDDALRLGARDRHPARRRRPSNHDWS